MSQYQLQACSFRPEKMLRKKKVTNMTAANYVKLVKLLGATNRYLLTPGVISNSE